MALRKAKTVTIDTDVLQEIENSRGTGSTSERLNQLLRAGLEAERMQKVDSEIASFFSRHTDDHSGTRAFQRASIKAVVRD